MRKYIITITPVLKNEPLPAIVLDVSEDDVSVNYPRDAEIKVDSVEVRDHYELCVKMPCDDKVLHLWYDNSPAVSLKKSAGFESSKIFSKLHSDIKDSLRYIPSFAKLKTYSDKFV